MAKDDSPLYKITKDISGGINNRQHGSIIGDNQVTVLKNVELSVLGESSKRRGITELVDMGDGDKGTALHGFMPVGGTDLLIATHGQKLETITSAGSATERKTNFTASNDTTILSAAESGENDVVLVYVSGNNWFRMNQSFTFQDLGNTAGTGSDSPPASGVALWFRQRLWILKSNLLYYSAPFPADFSTAFDTVNDAYKVDIGTEKALISIRDQGIVVMGQEATYGVNPSTTPDATDKVEKLLDIGCAEGKTAVQVGDDVLFLANDGVRGLFRSQQDKLQTGSSFPLSYPLKTQFEDINWAQISKARATFFDNKYLLALPTGSSTENNVVWVYYPSTNAWVIIEGWAVSDWAKIKFSGGEEKLYIIKNDDDVVLRAFSGYSDDGTAIQYLEEGRKEDFEKPLVTKCGGELRIKALAVGDYELSVYAEIDDGGYNLLGTASLANSAPILPVSLPFVLGAETIVEKVFHLDSLGPFKQIRIKIEHNDTNGSDDIKVYERTVVTYADEYQSE